LVTIFIRYQNFVSNPYPTPIDWNSQIGWNKTNISSTIYFRNGNRLASWNGEAGVNGGTRYIPAMQGFIVVSSGTSVLELNDNAKVSNAQANQFFWKDEVANILRLKVEGGNYDGDETVIIFKDASSENYDFENDGLKLFEEQEEYSHLYTVSSDDNKLCINNMPQAEVVDLYFESGETAVYTISVTEMNLTSTDVVYLEDRFTGKFVELSSSDYSFTYNQGDVSNRFRLHFSKTTNVEDIDNEIVNVYSFGSDIYINTLANKGEVLIYSVTGAELMNCELRKVINTNLANGVYTVKVTTERGTYITKIFINK